MPWHRDMLVLGLDFIGQGLNLSHRGLTLYIRGNVLNGHELIINIEYFTVGLFNILVRITNIRTLLAMSSMILCSVYLLIYLLKCALR